MGARSSVPSANAFSTKRSSPSWTISILMGFFGNALPYEEPSFRNVAVVEASKYAALSRHVASWFRVMASQQAQPSTHAIQVNGRRSEHQVPIDAVNHSDDKTCGEKTADHYFYRYRSNIPHPSTTCSADASSTKTANALYQAAYTVSKMRSFRNAPPVG